MGERTEELTKRLESTRGERGAEKAEQQHRQHPSSTVRHECKGRGAKIEMHFERKRLAIRI